MAQSQYSLQPGTRIGDYEILAELGAGSFGITYKAWDHRLQTYVALKEYLPIEFADEGATKRVTIADRIKGFVTQIRGRDRNQPVVFDNIFNQIHASRQVIALGDTEYRDEAIVINNTGTHGLFSNFDWRVN